MSRQYDLSDYEFAMNNTKYNAQGRAVIEKDDDWRNESEWDDIFVQMAKEKGLVLNKGEVWFVEFPYEDDPTKTSNRPVVVLDENRLGVLSVKITKHAVRPNDKYDVPIIYWQEANLRLASTARVSKIILLNKDDFIFKIGDLHPDDLRQIEETYNDFKTHHFH